MPKKKKKLRVALFFGGKSDEREVSLSTGKTIAEHLDTDKYEVIPVEVSKGGKFLLDSPTIKQIGKAIPTTKLDSGSALVPFEEKAKSQIDLAFLALHGPGGEDGTIQGMLDLFGTPYTFSGTLASALAMDKAKTKRLAASVGIPVLPHLVISKHERAESLKKFIGELKGKVVVKPNSLGSSIGVVITDKHSEMEKALKAAFRHSEEVLVEPWIRAREITVPVLGNRLPEALPVIEIIPLKQSKFYDFEAKYQSGGSRHDVPADLDQALAERASQMALQIHKLLGCRGATRSDFLLDEKGELYFLEINTIPGMTPTSLVPESAKEAGISYSELLDRLIDLGLEE